MEARGHYHHVSFNEFFATRSPFRNALGSVVEAYSCFSETDYVPAKPFCFAGADLMEDIGVYHGCFGEEACGWGS